MTLDFKGREPISGNATTAEGVLGCSVIVQDFLLLLLFCRQAMKCISLFFMTERNSDINDEKMTSPVKPVLSWGKEKRSDLFFGIFGRLITP